LDPVLLVNQAFVHFQEGNDAFFVPEIVCAGFSFDIPVHCALEQDGSNNPIAIKGVAANDARAHLMHEGKHFLIVRPRTFLDSISLERLGRAATTLVQRSNEAGLGLKFSQILFCQARRVHKESFTFGHERFLR
jgi:hypothetical protein